jgi:hypothetical protein
MNVLLFIVFVSFLNLRSRLDMNVRTYPFAANISFRADQHPSVCKSAVDYALHHVCIRSGRRACGEPGSSVRQAGPNRLFIRKARFLSMENAPTFRQTNVI